MFSLKYFIDLPVKVGDELQQLVAGINTYLQREHKVDGAHGAITADSVTLGSGMIGEWVDVPLSVDMFDTDSSDVTWTVDPTDNQNGIQYCLCGSLAIVQFYIVGTLSTVSADKATEIFITIPGVNAQKYKRTGNGGVIIYNNLGAANNNTDGHFPIDILSEYGGGPLKLALNRFNAIERGGASTQYGNWRNEATTVYGQIAVRTTPNNEVSQDLP